MRRFLTILLMTTCLIVLAGEKSHGLALYGPQDLKYTPGKPYGYANPEAPKGGMLRLSYYGAPFTKLNPFTMKGSAAPHIGTLVFETLMDGSVDENEPFSQYGLIAQQVKLADDKTSLTYWLNPHALFSDGKPLTADDVVFSWNLIFDPNMPPFYRAYYADVEKCVKDGPHQVTFHFKTFNQELPLIMGQLRILPKHVYGRPGKNFGEDFNDVIPIGSGPYRVKNFKMGEEITFERNKDYWGKDVAVNKGRYNFDLIYYRNFLDPIGHINSIKAGTTDVEAVNRAKSWVEDFDTKSIDLGHLKKWTYPSNRVSGMSGFIFNSRNPMFKDRRVRLALASVFDFAGLNRDAFFGLYQRQVCYFDVNKEMKSRGAATGDVRRHLLELRKKHGAGFVPKDAILRGPVTPGADTTGKMIPHAQRIEAAATYLDSLGWKYDAELKTRVKDGVTLQIEFLLYNKSSDYVVNPYLGSLRKLGVKADYRVVQVAEYVEKLKTFEFDMIFSGWGQSLSPGNEQRNYWSKKSAGDRGSRNFSGIENDAIDEVIDKLIHARTRKDLVTWIQVMDRILCAEHLLVPGWNSPNSRVLYWQRFSHPETISSRMDYVDNVINWWWYDADKASKLDAAIKSGKPFKE